MDIDIPVGTFGPFSSLLVVLSLKQGSVIVGRLRGLGGDISLKGAAIKTSWHVHTETAWQ